MIEHSGAIAIGDLLQASCKVWLAGCPGQPGGGVMRRLRHVLKVNGGLAFGEMRGFIASPCWNGVLGRVHEMAARFVARCDHFDGFIVHQDGPGRGGDG